MPLNNIIYNIMVSITPIELWKHGFEEEEFGIWRDQHYRFFMFEKQGLYYQCFENDNSIEIGIPLTNLEELQKRYESITGKAFIKVDERPLTAQ